MAISEELIKFNLFSLVFEPYKKDSDTLDSNDILKQVASFIFNEKKESKGYLVNRYQGRKNESPRELFMTSLVFMHKERRLRCSIALLRSGRVPKLKPKNKFELVPLKDMGEIAEETHFYIDYSKSGYAVLCVEYNHHGPRMSDIEFYLRHVSHHKLKISKATRVNVYMNNSIDKTLAGLKNVLNFDMKIQPNSFAQMNKELVGNYFTGLNNFGNSLKPKFIKLEAMYQTPGKEIVSSELNSDANTMIKKILSVFKKEPFNIDCFDNFVVRYEDINGQEEVFNLLKEKVEFAHYLDLKKIKKKRDLYSTIEGEFDDFITNIGAHEVQ